MPITPERPARPSTEVLVRRALGAAALTTGIGALSTLGACSPSIGRAAITPTGTVTTAPATVQLAGAAPAPSTTTTVTAPGAPPPEALTIGAKGPAVLALQHRLADLRYDVGDIDGSYGESTFDAVMAFEKVSGLARDGAAGEGVLDALAHATDPAPGKPRGAPTRVEVDIPRQVLFFYLDGRLDRILPVSTGYGGHYCELGQCSTAVTPGGTFHIGRRIAGWYQSPLGRLYNPMFFNGGIAIHGFGSVPASPASHGCVRIPLASSEWFFGKVPDGTEVDVLGTPVVGLPATTYDPGTDPSTTIPGSVPSTTAAPTPTPPAPPSKGPATTPTTRPAPPTTAPPGTAPANSTQPPTTQAPTTQAPTTQAPTTQPGATPSSATTPAT
ncbi:MAG: L,D-transpeptidase family protein [Acidimicrobiales bacterium]